MPHFFVYILKCSDESYYVGHTDDLETRIEKHITGKWDSYTALRLPIELVFKQEFDSRSAALALEQKIKGWSRRKKEALICGDYEKLKEYSKKIFK